MRFRIKETYKITQWTYIIANSKEEAIKKLEGDFAGYDSEEIDAECEDTDWDSLEEVK